MTTESITNSTYYVKTLELYPNDTNIHKVEPITQQQYEQFISNNNGQVQSTTITFDKTTHTIVLSTNEEIL